MHEGDNFCAKTLGKSLFHFQTDWSDLGPAGQFRQMESSLSFLKSQPFEQKYWTPVQPEVKGSGKSKTRFPGNQQQSILIGWLHANVFTMQCGGSLKRPQLHRSIAPSVASFLFLYFYRNRM